MSKTVDQFVEDFELLPNDQKAELLDRISCINMPEDIQASWHEELLRRKKAVESGESKPVPGEEVFDRLKKKYGL